MRNVNVYKRWHKWLSLIVGIQLIIWLVTGLYFNVIDHKQAVGNANRQSVAHQGQLADFQLIPVTKLNLAPLNIDGIKEVHLLWLLKQPFYQVIMDKTAHRYQVHQAQLFDAVSGQPFSIDEAMAKRIATLSYTGAGEFGEIRLMQPPIAALPQFEMAVWQVKISDKVNTEVYIDNNSGQVIAHVNDARRLRNLMYKLHFMDYANTGSFNHWLIIIVAIGTFLLAITGGAWLILLIKSGKFSIAINKQSKSIIVLNTKGQKVAQIAAQSRLTVLEALHNANVSLKSNCGGGGVCGRCRFKTNDNLVVSAIDEMHLDDNELSEGFRLGCQHESMRVDRIVLEDFIASRPSKLTIGRSI